LDKILSYADYKKILTESGYSGKELNYLLDLSVKTRLMGAPYTRDRKPASVRKKEVGSCVDHLNKCFVLK